MAPRALSQGFGIMSTDIETMGEQLLQGRVPSLWLAVSYPSLLPVGAWVTDLAARFAFMRDWINTGHPSSYWISGV
jgi:dynein heavy chain